MGRRAIIAIVVMAAAAAVLLPARPGAAELTSEQRGELLGEALESYDRGIAILRRDPAGAKEHFAVAAARLQMLVDDGVVNGPLLYDLGNAYLQAGDLGRAILSYRRAEAFIPGDARLEGNLEYARSLRQSRIAPSGERALTTALLAWHERTPLGARFITFAAAYAAFWLVLLVARFRPGAGWRYAAAGLAVLWLASGASVAADAFGGGDRAGVLLADEVVLRKGNGEGFEPAFEEPLHEGVEFDVLETRPGWHHIRLADGSTGWVRADQAGLVAR